MLSYITSQLAAAATIVKRFVE